MKQFFMLLGIMLLLPVAFAAEPEVELAVPVNIYGDDEPVPITLRIEDQEGNPIEAMVHFTLDASPKRKLISTDFPIVEGSQMIDIQAMVNGKLSFEKFFFPIRGNYKAKVSVTPTDKQFSAVTKTFNIAVKEKPAEVRNAVLFIFAILALGFVVGLLYGYQFSRD